VFIISVSFFKTLGEMHERLLSSIFSWIDGRLLPAKSAFSAMIFSAERLCLL